MAIVALILYGSLYPWEFHWHALDASPFKLLLRLWPTQLNRFVWRDLGINILLYIPLGVAACLTLPRRIPASVRIVWATALGGCLSTIIELLQIFDATRMASTFDIACNLAGTAGGAVAAAVFGSQIETALRFRAREWRSAPAASALLVLWVGVQLYPLFPAFSQRALYTHLAALRGAPFSLAVVPMATAEWLAAALLVEVCFQRGRALKFLCLGLLLPGRLLIAGGTVSVTDAVAFAAAFVLWRLLPARTPQRYFIAAGLLLAALVFQGLRPFRFAAEAASFRWTPFGGVLGMDQSEGARILARKAFRYGAAVSLFRLAMGGYFRAAALIATVLAALEFVQRWIPGHVPEITDPLLALLLAGGLWLLDQHYRARQPKLR